MSKANKFSVDELLKSSPSLSSDQQQSLLHQENLNLMKNFYFKLMAESSSETHVCDEQRHTPEEDEEEEEEEDEEVEDGDEILHSGDSEQE